jgi:hypothetical protein
MKPIFIQTSAGYINLALVAHISQRKNETRFTFIGSQGNDYIEVPIKEGEQIISWLRETSPELFLG